MSASPAFRAVHIAGATGPVFGLFHGVAAGSPGGVAVLICPPFGWEEVCSYRSRREWACALARAGSPTLRIDLPGSGDSGGSSADPNLVDAWVAAVENAALWLRAQTGCERIATIGIGLGGLLAVRAVAGGAPIDELVLWGVPARGRSLVRELRAFALLNPAEADEDPPADGQIETGGFLLSPETQAAIASIDLTKLPSPDPGGGGRILMLERDGLEVDQRLLGHLRETPMEITVAPGPGYGAMMAHPQDARPPLAVFAAVEAWLERDDVAATRAPSPLVPELPEPVEIAVGDAVVRERSIEIEQPFGRLFGVLTEPVAEPALEVCAVLLNAGALRRIGPGRMWVEIARRWAALGVPTLRLDIEGIGDADGDGTRYGEVKELYVPRLIDQVIAALDDLESRGMPRHFLLCGLCSGAYWSFHAALRDERVAAAFMVNPRALYWDDSLLAAREVRKTGKLLQGASWRRILRGELSPARFLEHGRWTLRALAHLPAQLLRRRARRRQLDAALDRLRTGGKRILFVFGEREPLHDELLRDGRLPRVDRWPNLQIQTVSGGDHSLEPIPAQRRVHERLNRALEAELALL